MTKFRVVRGHIARYEEGSRRVHKAGAVVELDEKEQRKFKELIEPFDEPAAAVEVVPEGRPPVAVSPRATREPRQLQSLTERKPPAPRSALPPAVAAEEAEQEREGG